MHNIVHHSLYISLRFGHLIAISPMAIVLCLCMWGPRRIYGNLTTLCQTSRDRFHITHLGQPSSVSFRTSAHVVCLKIYISKRNRVISQIKRIWWQRTPINYHDKFWLSKTKYFNMNFHSKRLLQLWAFHMPYSSLTFCPQDGSRRHPGPVPLTLIHVKLSRVEFWIKDTLY